MWKGTRLNDPRYFRLPLPHTRKRTMAIRVMPRIVNSGSDRVVHCSKPNRRSRIGVKLQDRCRMVEAKQSSVQIASATYESFKAIEPNRGEHRDTCIETEVIELSKNLSSLMLREDAPATVADDSERLKFQQVANDCQRTTRETVYREKLRDCTEHSRESVDQKQNCGDLVAELEEEEEEEKYSSWWKDGGQTILQFFARILSKRTGMGAEGLTDRVLPTGKQHGKRVKRVPKDNKTHNRHRRVTADGSVRLKRVGNGYIANRVYRNESSRRKNVTENKSREEHRPSIYVRQIQRTRDKNLRIVLLQQELCAHLPKKDEDTTANGTVNATRQLSSPLC